MVMRFVLADHIVGEIILLPSLPYLTPVNFCLSCKVETSLDGKRYQAVKEKVTVKLSALCLGAFSDLLCANFGKT
jgi:hypothetical protein